MLFVGAALAQDEGPVTMETVSEHVATLTQTANLTWIVIGAALVICMEAGFAMIESMPGVSPAHGPGDRSTTGAGRARSRWATILGGGRRRE
ncbi:hypothetical protein [Rhabdothermincola sediminis]|uniref:hypothetical protein n=1 Tax=Rhabdothermincola sediminis TaxID=2751370 RepID=UPI001AA064B8|nr:hypothetical protein [Rhabdothermincola sediminis]